ncbi:MAG: xenobiotic ABC transporter ATP-binding protein [Candidatus Poribacteria bacterium]|nr:MAG: xenobiotic ABC transporter ATP-binding protein [Candidatus Poribacteria bacterium]
MNDYGDLFEEHELTKVYDREIFRRLMGYVRPYLRWVILGVFLILLAEAARNLSPYVAKVAIDRYFHAPELRGATLDRMFLALRGVLLLYAALLLLDLLASFLRGYVMQLVGQFIMRDMRMQIFGHILRLHVGFFDRTMVGRLMTRVMNDVAALNELFASGIVDSLGSLIGLTIIVAMMFALSWKLALITFCVLPVIGAATLAFQILSRRAYREWRRQLSRLNAFMNERIGGVVTVQLFGQEENTFRRFVGINTEYLRAALRAVLAMAFFGPLVELAGGLSTAIILWYGGGQVVQNATTIGELFAFLTWGQRFFWPLRNLSAQYNTLLIAMASSERIFQLLDTRPEVVEKPDAIPLPEFREAIEFRNVWFAYEGENYVLEDINLTIRKGERVAVVGATGSGKTTLTNLLCRFYDVQKGAILIDGYDIRDLRIEDLRRHIAIVQQDVLLFTGTVRDNIRLFADFISDEQVEEAARIVQADRFIRALPNGYETVLQEGGATLSVGQRQLLAFARALAFNPEILILDEATASIDTETELLIQEGLKRLLQNRTSIMIAHRLSTIRDADKIVVIHRGRIREMGTHAELLQLQGIYYRLYQLQYRDQELLAAGKPRGEIVS